MGNVSTAEKQPSAVVKCKILKDGAKVPERMTPGAAGFDVTAIEEQTICPGCAGIVNLGIAIECPPGTYCRTANRSSMARNYNIIVMADVIDADYTGECTMMLFNLGNDPFLVHPGQRIGQFIFERNEIPEVVTVERLSNTDRGYRRFGSTD